MSDRPDLRPAPPSLPVGRVAFIGLGTMGMPMARNLSLAGFEVVGHNRHENRADEFREFGGRWASSVATAVERAHLVATMLPDPPQVVDVLAGPGGAFGRVQPGSLFVDFSTIRPDVSRQLANEGRGRGLRVLDAPVSGGEQGAVDRTLSIMVGGDLADFTAASPVLNAVGRTIVHVGPAGSGQTVKAANQLIVAGTIALRG